MNKKNRTNKKSRLKKTKTGPLRKNMDKLRTTGQMRQTRKNEVFALNRLCTASQQGRRSITRASHINICDKEKKRIKEKQKKRKNKKQTERMVAQSALGNQLFNFILHARLVHYHHAMRVLHFESIFFVAVLDERSGGDEYNCCTQQEPGQQVENKTMSVFC